MALAAQAARRVSASRPQLVPVAAINHHPAVDHGKGEQVKQAILLYAIVVLGVVTAVYILPPLGKPAVTAMPAGPTGVKWA